MRRLPIVATILLAACGARDRARTAISDSTAVLRVQPGSVAGAMVLQLWQLHGGVTLGDWKNAHPDEPVSGADTSAMSSQLGDWCAAAQRREQIGARMVTRTAFFYPPPAPADLAPPDSVPDLVRRCLLGLVWVRAEVPDSQAAALLSDSIATQLAAAYGAADPSAVHFWGSALWSRTTRYHRGDVTAVAAERRPGPVAGAGPPPGMSAVFAFAFVPIAVVSVDGAHGRPAYAPADSMPLDSAAALVQADTARYAPLRALARGLATPPGTAHAPAELVEPLRRWLAATAGLPAPRRAAALYVADQVLERAMCSYGLCELDGRASRAPLEALGATFQRNELGGGWVYEHTWLNQARTLDRDSPLGQRLFLAQAANAFDYSGTCAAGTDGFRRVIDNGERYLARLPASPIAADVHFLTAEAYRDIVALARGAGGDYADSSRYGAEAGPAALKALAHYREAMKAGPQREVARAAWQRAWWLKAGLIPRDVRFYCVYD